jgi:hypothetical protein
MARIFKQDFRPEIDGFMRMTKVEEGNFDKGTSNEAVMQSKERYINDFSLPKINEDAQEHDHTGKKKSTDTSSEPLLINDDQYLELQMQRSLAAQSAMVVILESSPAMEDPRDEEEEKKDAVKDLTENQSLQMSPLNTSQRPSSRKNFIIDTKENVSFRIKPQRFNRQLSEQKESLLQNDEMAEFREFQEDEAAAQTPEQNQKSEPASRPTTAQP